MPVPHYDRVKRYMELSESEVHDCPTIPADEERLDRGHRIVEETLYAIETMGLSKGTEADEIIIEEAKPDIVDIARGLVRLQFALTQAFISFGLHPDPIVEEFDKTRLNMYSTGHVKDDQGRLTKPPNWTPPRIDHLVAVQSMSDSILGEMTDNPLPYRTLWLRLGSPEKENGRVFDDALASLVQFGRLQKTMGMSLTEYAYYV